jgi:hypothetical protein
MGTREERCECGGALKVPALGPEVVEGQQTELCARDMVRAMPHASYRTANSWEDAQPVATRCQGESAAELQLSVVLKVHAG